MIPVLPRYIAIIQYLPFTSRRLFFPFLPPSTIITLHPPFHLYSFPLVDIITVSSSILDARAFRDKVIICPFFFLSFRLLGPNPSSISSSPHDLFSFYSFPTTYATPATSVVLDGRQIDHGNRRIIDIECSLRRTLDSRHGPRTLPLNTASTS